MSMFPRKCGINCPNEIKLKEVNKEISRLMDIIKMLNDQKRSYKCFVEDSEGHPTYDCHNRHRDWV